MRAHQIMTRSVISVTPDTSIVEAREHHAEAARQRPHGGRR